MLTLDVALPPVSGQDPGVYELGLVGAEYLQPNGTGSTQISVFDTAGYVGGFSLRFNGTGTTLGQDVWLADTNTALSIQVGLTGAEFQTALAVASYAAGYRFSTINYLSANGFAAGTSLVMNNTDIATAGAGKAVWVANAATGQTKRVGLWSSGYAKTTGYVNSLLGGISLHGETWGTSSIYDSTNADDGQAAWVADTEGTTQRAGFFGTGYRSSTGRESSTVARVNGSGYAIGTSSRLKNAADLGTQAWVQNIAIPGSLPLALGLDLNGGAGTEFAKFNPSTPADVTRVHGLSYVGDGNYIGGFSSRFNGTQGNGQGAWVHTIGGSTVRVGLLGVDPNIAGITYTQGGSNFQHSAIVRISANGIAVGASQRFSTNATNDFLGRATFIINVPNNATTQAGLTTGIFNSTLGLQENVPVFVSSSGWVVGTATRYSGETANGTATWVAAASTGTTFQIGLAEANAATPESSSLIKLTESGYIAGSSSIYVGGQISGNAAWIAKAADHSTTRLGLYTGANGSTYKSSNGTQDSLVEFLTESGYAAGYSARYFSTDTSTANGGATSWIYNISSGTFTPISLSIRVTNNYSNTRIKALYETGLALGIYELFDPTGVALGDRAFAWTPADGYYDLGVDIGATLGIDGWASLNNALYADIYGRILGQGTRLTNSTSGDSAYIFGVIPEPSTCALSFVGVGLIGFARRRRAA